MLRPEHGDGVACARAALAGNPSDGYGGAVVALAFGEQRTQATATRAPKLAVEPRVELVEATVRRFARDHETDALSSTISWSTNIPRGVGLGGSSAIVIATLRALCELYCVELDRASLAGLALAVETDELGIAAGLQDRVAQSYEGLTFMDFAEQRSERDAHGRYEQIDPGDLPPLVIAWRADAAEESGGVHAALRERFACAERGVVTGMSQLGQLGRRARDAIGLRDHAELCRCVDGSFDVRQMMVSLDPRHVEMIECARAHGAAANYTGSGGAIVAVCVDPEQRSVVRAALEQIGAQTVLPALGTSKIDPAGRGAEG